MKRRTSRIILIVSGLVVVALALSAYVFHACGKRTVENYRKQLRANGERLTISELRPRAVPAEQNSLETFQAANRLLSQHRFFDANAPSPMRWMKPGKAMVAWAQPEVRNEKTNTWQECQAAAAEERQLMELLEEIIERPSLDFHLDYSGGANLLLPHLAPLKRCAQRLSFTAVCDLQRGDTTSAIVKIRAMLAIANGMQDERLAAGANRNC